jgi:hypothetical protein
VYFEGSPLAKEPYCVMLRELPNLICSHVPMEIFLLYEMGKKQGNQKRALLRKGRFLYSYVLLRFGNTLRLTLSSATPSGEHAHMGTSLTNKRGNTILVLKAPYSHISCLGFTAKSKTGNILQSKISCFRGK